MFRYAYDQNGCSTAIMQELYIATGTVIELGEIVAFTPGTGVVATTGTDLDGPSIGVSAEAHDGSTAGRQVGLKIKVYTSPSAVFVNTPKNALTATGGSTTTFVDSSILPATDDYFNGGYIQILTCAADSDLVGKRVLISDFTGSGGTITLAETLTAALASGDTAYLCPGPLALSAYGWDLDSDGMEIDFESSAGEGLVIVDVDPATFQVFVKLRLHQLGNGPAAL